MKTNIKQLVEDINKLNNKELIKLGEVLGRTMSEIDPEEIASYKVADFIETKSPYNSVILYGIEKGCTTFNLYEQFGELIGHAFLFAEEGWLCYDNGKKYKMSENSYVYNYDGFLYFENCIENAKDYTN